jgi:hypothetical protein
MSKYTEYLEKDGPNVMRWSKKYHQDSGLYNAMEGFGYRLIDAREEVDEKNVPTGRLFLAVEEISA